VTFLSLADPLVNLTLSSLARATITFLYKHDVIRSMLRDRLNLPLGGGNVLGDLTSVGSVVHKQQFKVFLVSEQKLLEATGEHVSGGLVLLGADLGHAKGTSESSSHGTINTSRLSPGFLNEIEGKITVVCDVDHLSGVDYLRGLS